MLLGKYDVTIHISSRSLRFEVTNLTFLFFLSHENALTVYSPPECIHIYISHGISYFGYTALFVFYTNRFSQLFKLFLIIRKLFLCFLHIGLLF